MLHSHDLEISSVGQSIVLITVVVLIPVWDKSWA